MLRDRARISPEASSAARGTSTRLVARLVACTAVRRPDTIKRLKLRGVVRRTAEASFAVASAGRVATTSAIQLSFEIIGGTPVWSTARYVRSISTLGSNTARAGRFGSSPGGVRLRFLG